MGSLDIRDSEQRVIGKALRAQAASIGDDVFLMHDEERWSYAAVDARVNSYAHGFTRMGVERADTVSLMLPNCLDFVFAALALNKIGAAWVPTNTAFKGEWLRNTLVDARADLLVIDHQLIDRIAPLAGETPVRRALVRGQVDQWTSPAGIDCQPLEVLDTGCTTEPDVDVGYRDLSAVMWTSGTTGRSKGVMQSHGCWLANADILARSRGVSDGDALYCSVPLFNSGGWSLNVFSALVSGVAIGIDTSFSVTDFWDRCRLYGATHILTLGAMHMFLWNAPRRDDDADNPVRLGACVPMPNDLVGPFKERFGIEIMWEAFGQSEMMGWTLRDTIRDDWKANSCGVVRADLDVKLFDQDDREVPVGEVGEVCIRPREPEVMFSGYFGRPQATLDALRNLWYHSGDLARFDEDGEMFFVDRKSDFMRFGGRNVSSFDVESALHSHPAVAEVAAHGVRSIELASEDEVKVCVVLKAGMTASEADLARHVNDNAPYFLVPRYIELVDELPHTPTGRVQKYLLRDRGVTAGTWDRVASGFVVTR